MKKRMLSILLICSMMLTLLPTVAVAADGTKAIQAGTSGLQQNANTENAPTIYFGQNHENKPGAWRVVGYDGNGAAGQTGYITLLAANNMGLSLYGTSFVYADSTLKTAIDTLAGKLTTAETAAVEKRTLVSGSYDEENTDCVAGAAVSDAVFWPLSTKEANAVDKTLRMVDPANQNWASNFWWLRSPGGGNGGYISIITGRGDVADGYVEVNDAKYGVRPAFHLNSDAVLFLSAAEGDKPFGLQQISDYNGNEWKLTIQDSKHGKFTAKTTAVNGSMLTVEYANAEVGKNEYLSAVIKDADGNMTHYGHIANLNGTASASDTVEINLSGIDMTGKRLYVFNEQCNGDKKTDYASALQEVALSLEQLNLTPGDTYYFDLSGVGIPGLATRSQPDTSLHYVPFTYAGTVDAYKLTSGMPTTEEYAQQNKYLHSLFVAEYNVTNVVKWDTLNERGLIFGKDYTTGGVDYTLRAPSVGSRSIDNIVTPKSNEWDKILDKNNGYIKNLTKVPSWGQDSSRVEITKRAVRGAHSARDWSAYLTEILYQDSGFRPVLEVLNPDTLGADGLKAVTLALNGGKLGGSTEDIQILVKNGERFTAPASDGLTRPKGNTGTFFTWLGSDGNFYAPGASVPADVTTLTAQWTAPIYTVTLHTNGGTIAAWNNVTAYSYGTGARLPNMYGTTRTGYTFDGWYDNADFAGTPVTAISDTEIGDKEYWAKWKVNQYTVTVKPENNEADITITQDYGTPITAPVLTREGYTFTGWDTPFPATMPAENPTITAQWAVNQYTITYNLDGGTAEGNLDSYTIETATFSLENPTKPGYTFTGWSGTDLTGEDNKTVTVETGSTGNRVYTAHWRHKSSGHASTYYTLSFDTGGGSMIASERLRANTAVDLTKYTPTYEGYTFTGWYSDKALTNSISNLRMTGNKTVYAGWQKQTDANPFTDVRTADWFYNDVLFVYENGLIRGTSDTLFSPHATTTRGMMATILWRMEGSPAPKGKTAFTDVNTEKWYADAIAWTTENGLFAGYSQDLFGPDDAINREQLASIFYRYASYKGYDVTAMGKLDTFKDASNVSNYAKTTVQWAVGSGLIKGKSGDLLDPQGTATRAEIATILHRFLEQNK